MSSEKSSRKSSDAVGRFVESVAAHKGWILNRDSEFVAYLVEGLRVNHERYGFYQCPCRDSYGDRSKDEDIMCPCVYAQPDIDEYGQCFCGLYLDPEFYTTREDIDGIPERRPEERFPD